MFGHYSTRQYRCMRDYQRETHDSAGACWITREKHTTVQVHAGLPERNTRQYRCMLDYQRDTRDSTGACWITREKRATVQVHAGLPERNTRHCRDKLLCMPSDYISQSHTVSESMPIVAFYMPIVHGFMPIAN